MEFLFPGIDDIAPDMLVAGLVPMERVDDVRAAGDWNFQRPVLGPLCPTLFEIVDAFPTRRPIRAARYTNQGATESSLITLARVTIVPDVNEDQYLTLLTRVREAVGVTGACASAGYWLPGVPDHLWPIDEQSTSAVDVVELPSADPRLSVKYRFWRTKLSPELAELDEIDMYRRFDVFDAPEGPFASGLTMTMSGAATDPDVAYGEATVVSHVPFAEALIITEVTVLANSLTTTPDLVAIVLPQANSAAAIISKSTAISVSAVAAVESG